MKLELACESKEEPAQPTVSHLGQLKLSFEPLLSASISIDIIDWLVICYGSHAFAAFLSKARESASSDMGNAKFSGKVELSILLTVEGKVDDSGFSKTSTAVDSVAIDANDAQFKDIHEQKFEKEITLIPGFTWPNISKLNAARFFSPESSVDIKTTESK